MWYVILFPNEDTVSVIPSTWYIEATEECFWPPQREKKDIDTLVKRRCPPADQWEPYKAKILGKFDDYHAATVKLMKAKEKDKLSSTDCDELGRGKRKKTTGPKRRHSSSDSVSDSDSSLRYPDYHALGEANNEQRSNHGKKRSLSAEHTKETGRKRFCRTLSRSLSPISNSKENATSQNSLPSKQSSSSKRADITLVHSNRSEESGTEKNSVTIIDMLKRMQAAESEFRVQVFRKLSVMNNKLNDLWEAIEKLKSAEHEDQPPQTVPQFNMFPLNEQAIEIMENDLGNQELSTNLSKQLSMVGGANTAEIVKRLMYKMFTNEVGCQYSWEGAKGKRKFKNLKIYNVVLNAVRLNKKTCSATEAEVIIGIKKWLVRAKDRLKSGNSKIRVNGDDDAVAE